MGEKMMGCESEEDVKELEQLKNELAKDPKNVDLLLKIGMLLFDPFIDMDQGLPYFEKAMELDPDNPDLPFWAGYALYHDQSAYEDSKKLFERALSLDSDRAEFHYMLFSTLWDMRNNKTVDFKHLLMAIELQPKWFFPREHYIKCLIINNELNKAEEELATAYDVLEKHYKDKKVTGANIMEQYYIDHSSGKTYEIFNRGLDRMKKRLKEKKEKLLSAPSKAES